MAKFLNTTLLNEWIPKLINETQKELVIIVPYIKTSERIKKTVMLMVENKGIIPTGD